MLGTRLSVSLSFLLIVVADVFVKAGQTGSDIKGGDDGRDHARIGFGATDVVGRH